MRGITFCLIFVTFMVAGCKSKESVKDDANTTTPSGPTPSPTDVPPEAVGSLSINMTKSASASIPQVSAMTASQIATLAASGSAPVAGTIQIASRRAQKMLVDYAVGDTVVNKTLLDLFAFQCHSSYGTTTANHCPSSYILPEQANNSPYKFRQNSLIGIIFHGDSYATQNYACIPPGLDCENQDCTTCETCWEACPASCSASTTTESDPACDPCMRCLTQNKCANCELCKSGFYAEPIPSTNKQTITDDQIVLVSTTGAGGAAATDGDPERYFVPMPGVYNKYYETQNDGTQRLYHEAANNLTIADLHFSKTSTGASLAQTYLSLIDASTGRVMAIADTSINVTGTGNPSTNRSVLIVNFVTRRFVLKQRSYTGEVVAMGVGGRDPETGELYEGYYYADATYGIATDPSSFDHFAGCVNNATQKMVEDSHCATEKTLWTTGVDVAAYLELNAAESAHLDGAVDVFASADYFTDNEVPAASADLKHFPDKLAKP